MPIYLSDSLATESGRSSEKGDSAQLFQQYVCSKILDFGMQNVAREILWLCKTFISGRKTAVYVLRTGVMSLTDQKISWLIHKLCALLKSEGFVPVLCYSIQ